MRKTDYIRIGVNAALIIALVILVSFVFKKCSPPEQKYYNKLMEVYDSMRKDYQRERQILLDSISTARAREGELQKQDSILSAQNNQLSNQIKSINDKLQINNNLIKRIFFNNDSIRAEFRRF
jgi:hypothetical protein